MNTWPLDGHGSVAWMADPSERMQRASVALAVEGGCLVCDPVDAVGLDELLSGIGPVLAVCLLLDRHGRDSAAIAERHRAPLVEPGELAATPAFAGIEPRVLFRAHRWHETALWLPGRRLLVVAEAVGTIPFFLTRPGDRLGMHMLARLRPPRIALAGLDPAAIAVGHGAPVIGEAGLALARALRRPRLEVPRALWTAFSGSRQTR